MEPENNIQNGVSETPGTEMMADYIYVGEWGIKIKKPENWRMKLFRKDFMIL